MKIVKLHDAEIPALGFGTFELEGETARRMVETALALGYRHIDTAQIYGNEEAVGRGIADSRVAREEIFLTTKVWIDRYRANEFDRSVKESLEKLQTSYVDLLLLHWPNPNVPLSETIDALNAVRQAGMARHIGVSNFTRELLDRATQLSEAPLAMNQVEYHPFLNQSLLLHDLRRHGMGLTAYSPLAQGKVFKEPTLKRIGAAHGKTPGQVTLRWLTQQAGVLAIPRTANEKNAAANLQIFDFDLSSDEMSAISALTSANLRLVDPPGLRPDWD